MTIDCIHILSLTKWLLLWLLKAPTREFPSASSDLNCQKQWNNNTHRATVSYFHFSHSVTLNSRIANTNPYAYVTYLKFAFLSSCSDQRATQMNIMTFFVYSVWLFMERISEFKYLGIFFGKEKNPSIWKFNAQSLMKIWFFWIKKKKNEYPFGKIKLHISALMKTIILYFTLNSLFTGNFFFHQKQHFNCHTHFLTPKICPSQASCHIDSFPCKLRLEWKTSCSE